MGFEAHFHRNSSFCLNFPRWILALISFQVISSTYFTLHLIIFFFLISFQSFIFYLFFEIIFLLILGTIPDEFDRLPYLYSVDFNNNTFVGTIPSSFSSLTILMGLLFGINSFTGTAPEGFSTLTKLKYLTLSYNSLTGTVLYLYIILIYAAFLWIFILYFSHSFIVYRNTSGMLLDLIYNYFSHFHLEQDSR